MKSNAKSKIIILITLGILFALSPIITTNLSFIMGNSDRSSENSDEINLDNEDPKISKVSGRIYINDDSPTSNWSVAEAAGICTGKGTYSEPYIIEDLVIDGEGSGTCIYIRNSDVYFRIENCTVFNSGTDMDYDSGIKLLNATKGTLINNSCSSNYRGIYLGYYSNNNTLSGNIANNNYFYLSGYKYGYGIYLEDSNNNTLSGNTANNNGYGIYLENSNNNTVTGNLMNECGLEMTSFENDVDTTNLVNGKRLYYYVNEVNLGPNNFTNAGQVILVNCNDSIISNLNTSYSSNGISLHSSNNNNISEITANNNRIGISINGNFNTISGNTANNNHQSGISLLDLTNYNTISGNTANNNKYGIRLYYSSNNNISGNTANDNEYGIYLSISYSNTISRNNLVGNDVCIYEDEFSTGKNVFENNDCGEDDGKISGYNLFFLLGILSVAVILISKKLKKS